MGTFGPAVVRTQESASKIRLCAYTCSLGRFVSFVGSMSFSDEAKAKPANCDIPDLTKLYSSKFLSDLRPFSALEEA